MQDARRQFLVMHPHTGCKHQKPGGSPSQSTEVPYEEDALQLLLSHFSEKTLCTADALSYCHNPPPPPVRPLNYEKTKLETEGKAFVDSIFKYLPTTENRLEELQVPTAARRSHEAADVLLC